MDNNIQKLKYRLIEATTEDPNYPLYELLKGIDSTGWVSMRFCSYPQEILLQFVTPVKLHKIHILSNEKKIASMLEFYCYNLNGDSSSSSTNYKNINFEKLGYIRMDSNSRTNYKAREFRKIFVDINCSYLKIVLNKNHVNKYNVFNQVGLISLDFYGVPVIVSAETDITERDRNLLLDEISQEKLKILLNKKEEALKIEDYDEAKRLKISIDRIRSIGQKIFELETQKKLSVINEDFDNAKILKLEIERLKTNLRIKLPSIIPEKSISIELNRSYEENKESTFERDRDNIDMNTKLNLECEDLKPREINTKEKDINEEPKEEIKESSFIITNDIVDKSMLLNKSTNIKIIEKIDEEFLSHDEQIIPTLKKRLYNTSNTNLSLEEFKDESQLKSELEELDFELKNIYDPFIKYIGEDGLRRIFSKNILWKEEGLDSFNKKISKMFVEGENEINILINLIMKMLNSFLSEKHPQVCIRSIEIFETLLNEIKKSKFNLNYDFSITDRILSKIKEKVGDVNPKLRNKAVELYGFMLKQNFCDYNNLVAELVEDEMKRFSQLKQNRSSKMILGKLSIFQNIFNDFSNAIMEKRTDTNSFPFILVANYIIDNISHIKSDIRKLARNVLILMYKLFTYKKLEPLLKKVEEKELEKLTRDIPEVSEYLLLQNNTINITNPKKEKPRGRSSSRDLDNVESSKKSPKNKSNSPTVLMCDFCGKIDKKFISKNDIEDHIIKECVLFTQCIKCKTNIDLKKYISHLLNECENKNELKMCKRCKEPVDVKDYDSHVKENKCNPAKNPNSSNRCPLCHKDLPPQEKGFIQHFVKDICPKQKRRADRVTFVNGK